MKKRSGRRRSYRTVNSYLGKRAIVPEIALVGEAVANEAQLALLDILLDGIEEIVLGDLAVDFLLAVVCGVEHSVDRNPTAMAKTYLHLAIGPARDLNDHVQDGLLLVCIQRDIVERRDGHAIFLNVNAVLQGIGTRDLSCLVGRGHIGGRFS
jgi:hypothetical protein